MNSSLWCAVLKRCYGRKPKEYNYKLVSTPTRAEGQLEGISGFKGG